VEFDDVIDPVQVVLHVGDDEHSTARVPPRGDLLPEVDVDPLSKPWYGSSRSSSSGSSSSASTTFSFCCVPPESCAAVSPGFGRHPKRPARRMPESIALRRDMPRVAPNSVKCSAGVNSGATPCC